MFDNELHEKLDQILRRLAQIKELLHREGHVIMSALDDLTAQVTANTSLEQSAITLIQGLAAQLAAAGTDPAKLAALTTQLNSSSAALAAAITANTPAAPPTP
jgi:hypothetical protein